MSGVTFLWLGLATAVFVGANAVLKTYAVKGGLPVLVGALALFCLGNWLMVQVMKANGLGLAIALSAIFQLVAISVMAIIVFGERPSGLQLAGMAVGCVAVAMIAWPAGAKG
jgi:multidrug transporter EmrE-like cation transporter